MRQVENGKAFEYALAISFNKLTNAPIHENSSLIYAKKCFYSQKIVQQDILTKASDESAIFLQTHDQNISKVKSIIMQVDSVGIKGDVRDIILEIPKNQIGISAKHNHTAVKHSRLSDRIDFGSKWANIPCSVEYFTAIKPIFDELKKMKLQGLLFSDIKDKEKRIYLPILIAFQDELKRLCENSGKLFVERLFRYLLGKYDFYKIMLDVSSRTIAVIIQSVNIGGNLEYGSKWRIPERIISISFKDNSSNTLEVVFSHGWSIAFRLHNAKKAVEPSLKFDIQFVGLSSLVGQNIIKIA